MGKILLYNFSAEVDDLSHLFPNERLAQLAAIVMDAGAEAEVWDRGNMRTLGGLAPPRWKRRLAACAGRGLFRRIARNRELNALENACLALPLKWVSESMERDLNRVYARFVRDEVSRIRAGGFDMVLLNLWQGGFVESMALAAQLKANPGPRVYAIGQRVDWFQEHILRHFPQIDGIILGLGYGAVGDLARGRPFEELTDVAYRAASGDIVKTERSVTEVDHLPPPTYDPSVYHDIDAMLPLIHISLSNQACPNHCSFCPRPSNYGHAVRRKRLGDAVGELEALMAQGYRHFRIADSTPPPRLLTDFAHAIVERGLHERGLHLTAFSRVDQNREEDFPLLRRACFESLFFGLESLDDESLRKLNKGITYEGVQLTLEAAHDAGIFVVGSFIFPLPGTTQASRRRTMDRIRELKPWLDSVLAMPAGVYPTAEWGMHPERFGIELPPDYIPAGMNYPVKYIVPMRFWPPFPFSYPLFDRPAAEVTFDDIREAFESFCREVWQELGVCNVQDYALLVAQMVGEDPYKLTNRVKEILATRNYDALSALVAASHATTPLPS